MTMIKISAYKKLTSSAGPMALDVDIGIDKGSFVSLTGPSGSGKTTLLRIIAGLCAPDSGYISSDGTAWFDPSQKINMPPQKRNTGFVFQEYALFPNMTLRGNILYACGNGKTTDDLLVLADLQGVARLYPHQLSSGQKQRCCLLRAIARRPALLLLDEPFAALDRDIKRILYDELIKWHTVFGLTVIMVTHDRSEVVKLSERVLELRNGMIDVDFSSYPLTKNINTSGNRILHFN